MHLAEQIKDAGRSLWWCGHRAVYRVAGGGVAMQFSSGGLGHDVSPLLRGDMPTLIVWGERDRTIPLAHGQRAADEIPNCRFELLPNAAHFPNLEDPSGAIRRL